MKKNTKVRDSWIPTTWRYNGSGFQENKKKKLERKQKHKKDWSREND